MHASIDDHIDRGLRNSTRTPPRGREAHPAGTVTADRDGAVLIVGPWRSEEGSLVTEYGLLAVVSATVAGVIIQWASGGALVTLFNALLRQARALVGA